MQADDQRYYLRRAEAELALARRAVHPLAVRAHYHLAGHYLDRAHGAGQAMPPVPVATAHPPDRGFVISGG